MPVFVPNGGTIELDQPIRISIPASCVHSRILVFKDPYNRHRARTYTGSFTLKPDMTTLRAFVRSDDWQFGMPTPPVRFNVLASAVVGLDPRLSHLRPRDVPKPSPPRQAEPHDETDIIATPSAIKVTSRLTFRGVESSQWVDRLNKHLKNTKHYCKIPKIG